MRDNQYNMLFLIEMEQALHTNPQLSITEFVAGFRQKMNVPHYQLFNTQATLTQLYGCIVLPWERLRKRLPKKIMMSELSPEEWGYYKVLNHNPRLPVERMDLRFFLRQLRNAISHDNVRVSKERNITFRGREGFAVRYEWRELQKLIEQLGRL